MSDHFSAKIIKRSDNIFLNICDAELLDKSINNTKITMHIDKRYYGGDLIDNHEAESFLKQSTIINMVGDKIITLSLKLGIGSDGAVKIISDVPFLIVFKM